MSIRQISALPVVTAKVIFAAAVLTAVSLPCAASVETLTFSASNFYVLTGDGAPPPAGEVDGSFTFLTPRKPHSPGLILSMDLTIDGNVFTAKNTTFFSRQSSIGYDEWAFYGDIGGYNDVTGQPDFVLVYENGSTAFTYSTPGTGSLWQSLDVFTSLAPGGPTVMPSAAVVPEPAEAALLLAGLGVVSVVARRRKTNSGELLSG